MSLLNNCLALLISTCLLCSCSESPIRTLKVAEKGVVTSSISEDGSLGVIISSNHDSALWDLTKKKYLYSLRHTPNKQSDIIASSFNQKGDLLLTAERKNIILWNTKTGKSIVNYNLPSNIQAVALSKEGEQALIGLQNAKALLIDLNTGNPISSFQHTETINSVALSNNGKYALTGSDDHFAAIWDIKKSKLLHKLKHKKRVLLVGFSPDSNIILTNCLLDKIRLWDLKTGSLKYALDKYPTTLSTFKFSSNSNHLALGIFPQQLELWKLTLSKGISEQKWVLPKPSIWRPSATIINSIAFNHKKLELITLDSQGEASWWKI